MSLPFPYEIDWGVIELNISIEVFLVEPVSVEMELFPASVEGAFLTVFPAEPVELASPAAKENGRGYVDPGFPA